jgi:hypothetical protein
LITKISDYPRQAPFLGMGEFPAPQISDYPRQ